MKFPLRHITATIPLFMTLLSCGGTTTGNPLVTLKSAPYSAVAGSWFNLITPAYANVSSLTLCFKRLRFKPTYSGGSDGASADSTNFDFDLGLVTLSTAGNTLGTITLPAGNYRRVEFDLDTHCSGGSSVQLTNDNGPSSSSSNITIKFEGSFDAAGSEQTLSLQFQGIVTALQSVAPGDNLKTLLEDSGTKGSF